MSSNTNSLQSTLQFLSLPNTCPLSLIALNPHTGKPLQVNSTFEHIFGPFYKFQEWEFWNAACDDEEEMVDSISGVESNRTKFRKAIEKVSNSLKCSHNNGDTSTHHQQQFTTTVRNVEMLTLGTNEAGLPVRKYFDWTIGSVRKEDMGEGSVEAVILYGSLVNEIEESNR